MLINGKVVAGDYVNAMITTNRNGELALRLPLKRTPNLTADVVASWEEIAPDTRGGAVEAFSKVGQAVARAALPGAAGKAASAAVDSAVDAAISNQHTVRVNWLDGKQSLINLPSKLLQHLTIVLKDRRIVSDLPPPSAPPPSAPPPPAVTPPAPMAPAGVVGKLAYLAGAAANAQPDIMEQIAKLAAMRDQGVLTDEEFVAKKSELLRRI
jgi:hypothetical protein